MSGEARGMAEPDGSLPVVRVRVSCADASEYRRTRAIEFEMAGLFVPSKRVRPLGSRVRLKVELADRTLGHDGEAIVAAHKGVGRRRGYLLRLLDPVKMGSVAPPAPPTPAPERPRAAAATEAPRPPPVSHPLPVAADSTPSPRPLPILDLVPLPGFDPSPGRPPVRAPVPDAPRPRSLPPSLPRTPPSKTGGAAAATLARVELVQARPGTPAAGLPLGRPGPPVAPPRLATADAPPGDVERVGRSRSGALPATVAILAVAVTGGALLRSLGGSVARREAAFVDELRRADDRLRAGRLAAPAKDSALDHLVAARELRAADPRLAARLTLLAEKLVELGENARARGDLEEAAVHFRAALRADPRREAVRERLRELASPERVAAP